MKKNIIITGTSRGIGYELVALFANADHNVLALSRNEVPVSGLGASNCHCFPCDITSKKDIKKVSGFLKEHWKRVDVLINNSGYLVNKPFKKLTENDFKTSIRGKCIWNSSLDPRSTPVYEKRRACGKY